MTNRIAKCAAVAALVISAGALTSGQAAAQKATLKVDVNEAANQASSFFRTSGSNRVDRSRKLTITGVPLTAGKTAATTLVRNERSTMGDLARVRCLAEGGIAL